jgi:DNA processing protein
MDQEKLYQVALTQVTGIGPLMAKHLISYCGSAGSVFSANRSKLSKVPGIGTKMLQNLASPEPLKEAERIIKKAQQEDVRLLAYTDEAYPTRLKQIADAPILLYYRGGSTLNAARTLAIVGTRRCTAYGKTITEQLIDELEPYKPLVISGLAYGIDIIAHRACLKAGLPTIGVMASGPDIIYPPAHRQAASDMLYAGGLLTEYPFGTQPDAYNFPARNRIIAGLADAVVVVEAAAKGGALITAQLGLDYDREVFAVPGSLLSESSAGCHALIEKQQAHIFTSTAALVEELRWNRPAEEKKAAPALPPDLSPSESIILELLKNQPQGYQIDELSWRCQLPLSQLAGVLLELELKGLVRTLPGKKYTLGF